MLWGFWQLSSLYATTCPSLVRSFFHVSHVPSMCLTLMFPRSFYKNSPKTATTTISHMFHVRYCPTAFYNHWGNLTLMFPRSFYKNSPKTACINNYLPHVFMWLIHLTYHVPLSLNPGCLLRKKHYFCVLNKYCKSEKSKNLAELVLATTINRDEMYWRTTPLSL